jgi:hypothetical protein
VYSWFSLCHYAILCPSYPKYTAIICYSLSCVFSPPAPYRAAEAKSHGSVVSGGEMTRFPGAAPGGAYRKGGNILYNYIIYIIKYNIIYIL